MIGEIKRRIKEMGLTLRDIADATGCDTSYISKILSGKRPVPLERSFLKKLGRILGYDEDMFLLNFGLLPEKLEILKDANIYRKVLDMLYGRQDTKIVKQIVTRKDFGEELL